MKMSNGFEIAELAEVQQVDVVVQKVVVNNEAKNITGKAWAIVCPKCGRAIYQFPVGTSASEAYKAREGYAQELLRIASYCPSCGTKLSYATEQPIDAEVVGSKDSSKE